MPTTLGNNKTDTILAINSGDQGKSSAEMATIGAPTSIVGAAKGVAPAEATTVVSSALASAPAVATEAAQIRTPAATAARIVGAEPTITPTPSPAAETVLAHITTPIVRVTTVSTAAAAAVVSPASTAGVTAKATPTAATAATGALASASVESLVVKQKQEKEISLTGDFQIDFDMLMKSSEIAIDKAREKRIKDSKKIFMDFLGRCEEAYAKATNNTKRVEEAWNIWDQKIPKGILNNDGIDVKVETRRVIEELERHSVILTSTAVRMPLKFKDAELSEKSYVSIIIFYYAMLEKFKVGQKKVDELVRTKLPPILKGEIETIVSEDRVLFDAVIKKDLGLTLAKCRPRLMRAYQERVPVEFYLFLFAKQESFSHEKLAPINRSLFVRLKQIHSTYREKFKLAFQPLFALEDEKNVNGWISSELKNSDAQVNMLLGRLAEIPIDIFERFIATFVTQDMIEYYLELMSAIPKCYIQLMQSEPHRKVQPQMALIDPNSKEEQPAHISQADAKLNDNRTLKTIEQAQRAQAKEEESRKQEAMLLLKGTQDEQKKVQIRKDKAKEELLQHCKALKGAKRTLLIDIFDEQKDQHNTIKESLFVRLIAALKLPFTYTNKSSGGGKVAIPTVKKPIAHHHNHSNNNPGTLDGHVLKEFKEALAAIGITKQDIDKATKRPVPGLSHHLTSSH